MMQERLREGTVEAMLCDADLAPSPDQSWFDADAWRARGALHMQAGGRGGVAMIDTPIGACVLRHYRRGGMIATLLGDRYLWTGVDRTRGFAEFRLLAAIDALGLPAPRPVAARCVRRGPFYRADLITRRIADARTLAECLAEGALDAGLAEEVGALVARFHRAGIRHADLNAHNVLVTPVQLYLIDFDRGRQCLPRPGWRMGNLHRLRRSLRKLGAASRGEAAFEQELWNPLLRGYQRTFHA